MKRLHVNLGVADLEASVRFYTALFQAEPTILKADYAKWMLEDPRVNFAVSTRAAAAASITSAFRWRTMTSWRRCTPAWLEPARPCWSRATPCAATPGPRNAGYPIPKASPGRPF